MEKIYAAFISYASPDEELANNIKAVFERMNQDVYFAPIALKEEAGREWKEKVIEGMRSSCSILPIYTRNSIKRPWVLYELGMADAMDLYKFPARVSEILPEEINLPGKNVQIFRLFNRDDLTDLFTNIINLINIPSKDKLRKIETKSWVKKLINSLPEAKQIIEYSSTRWVFIAGSLPVNTGRRSKTKHQSIFAGKANYLLPRLTEKLLESGFSIASCPQVEYVGKTVCKEAISWITKNEQKMNRYKIAGIYPIDRDLRKLDIDESFKSLWRGHLLDFRKSYMEKQEWLIIAGGNEGTNEEYLAGIDKSVKVFSLPCFGGTGLKLWESDDNLKASPCVECNKKNGKCSPEQIKKIIERLKKTV